MGTPHSCHPGQRWQPLLFSESLCSSALFCPSPCSRHRLPRWCTAQTTTRTHPTSLLSRSIPLWTGSKKELGRRRPLHTSLTGVSMVPISVCRNFISQRLTLIYFCDAEPTDIVSSPLTRKPYPLSIGRDINKSHSSPIIPRRHLVLLCWHWFFVRRHQANWLLCWCRGWWIPSKKAFIELIFLRNISPLTPGPRPEITSTVAWSSSTCSNSSNVTSRSCYPSVDGRTPSLVCTSPICNVVFFCLI